MTIAFEIELDGRIHKFEAIMDVVSWADSEQRIWSNKATELKKNLGRVAQQSLASQQQYVDQLAQLAKNANNAGKNNAGELSALKQELQKCQTGQDSRMLCTLVEGDRLIVEVATKDADAAAAGVLLRRGPAHINLTVGDEIVRIGIRDAQARFQILCGEIRSEQARQKQENLIQDIGERYALAISMNGLIQHWRIREQRALRSALLYLSLFVASAAVIGYTSYHIAEGIWISMSTSILKLSTMPTSPISIDWAQIDTSKILLSAAPFAIIAAVPVIWIFRHMSRLFLDNLSDSRDAGLRHTMAKSYVAMTNDPNLKPSQQERAIILNALFRHGAMQSADEGIPLPVIELLKGK